MSKNEGELKKRINELREKEKELNKEYPSGVSKEVQNIVNAVLDIVQNDVVDAKKEFPKMQGSDGTIYLSSDFPKIEKWFEKWFGSEQKMKSENWRSKRKYYVCKLCKRTISERALHLRRWHPEAYPAYKVADIYPKYFEEVKIYE